ncbi:MAG: YHS domain-containing (seleno)protein [Gammaproteobacteria bacterium]
MSGILRFWFAPVLLLVGGVLLSAVVDSDDAVDLPYKFYQYQGAGAGFGAGGYDVVAYFDQTDAVRGKPHIKAQFGGEEWLFDTVENREKFIKAPERYIPQYGGHCAYAVSRNYEFYGDPKAWTVRGGKLYFNANTSVRRQWLPNVNDDEDGDRFIARSDENWRRFVTTGKFDI